MSTMRTKRKTVINESKISKISYVHLCSHLQVNLSISGIRILIILSLSPQLVPTQDIFLSVCINLPMPTSPAICKSTSRYPAWPRAIRISTPFSFNLLASFLLQKSLFHFQYLVATWLIGLWGEIWCLVLAVTFGACPPSHTRWCQSSKNLFSSWHLFRLCNTFLGAFSLPSSPLHWPPCYPRHQQFESFQHLQPILDSWPDEV